jgi:hypothetical protein
MPIADDAFETKQGVPLPITDDFQSRRVDGQVNGFVVMPSKSRDLDQGTPA